MLRRFRRVQIFFKYLQMESCCCQEKNRWPMSFSLREVLVPGFLKCGNIIISQKLPPTISLKYGLRERERKRERSVLTKVGRVSVKFVCPS